MICSQCGVRECIVRGNGRPLPACSVCWATKAEVGARSQNSRGYWRVKTEQGWRFEHVVLAESVLGRPLKADEHVGWADGDHSNNDLTNLTIGVLRVKPLLGAPKRTSRDQPGRVRDHRYEVRVDPIWTDVIEGLAATEGITPAAVVARSAEAHLANWYRSAR